MKIYDMLIDTGTQYECVMFASNARVGTNQNARDAKEYLYNLFGNKARYIDIIHINRHRAYEIIST